MISLPVLSLDNLSFSGSARTVKLLPSKHTETSIRHDMSFASTFQRQATGHVG